MTVGCSSDVLHVAAPGSSGRDVLQVEVGRVSAADKVAWSLDTDTSRELASIVD